MKRWTLTLSAALLSSVTGCGGCSNGPPSPRHETPTRSIPRWSPSHRTAPPTPSRNDLGTTGPYPGPQVSAIRREPPIRVRVRTNLQQLTITCPPIATGSAPTSLRVTGPRASQTKVHRYATPLQIKRVDGAWVLHDAAGQGVRWSLPELLMEADNGAPLQLDDARYPRRMVLVPRRNNAGQETGHFDAINHVPLETYLAGVIERELYSGWHEQAFMAQAVAARSYALWEMTVAAHRHYDLESTQASQVYGGQSTHKTALRAVNNTRGQAVTYEGRVVPAFFASSSGGLGQDALVAFPNRVQDIAPLRARQHGGWDKASPTYRWGPIKRSSTMLSRRIAAWGKRWNDPVASLGTLAKVDTSARNHIGRPSQFTLTNTSGQTFELNCEHFRNACNYSGTNQAPLPKAHRLLSSHVDVQVIGPNTHFTNGRGHGHGVGMSQWGAQSMAKAGHPYRRILEFYYPQASIHKLY